MNFSIDFLDTKKIFKYLLTFGVILSIGALLKDIAAILIVLYILQFSFRKRTFKGIEFFLIWFFCYGFYNSQSFITIAAVSKYITKPYFVLFCLFLLQINTIVKTLKEESRLLISVFLFFFVALTGLLLHSQSPFATISAVSFFLIYFIMKGVKLENDEYNSLLNLFVAVGILQFIVSILQLRQILPPPTTSMDDGYGNIYEWTAGLDDVACGTFGAISSHLVSWYESLMSIFLFLVWIVVRKPKYFIISALCLFQFSTVDSKTILVVTIVMILYLIFVYIPRNKEIYKLHFSRIFLFAALIVILGYAFMLTWNSYYQYFAENSGYGKRENLQSVYTNEVSESKDQITENFSDWGKIRGFQYLYDDFNVEGFEYILFGYGIQGYTWNGKMQYIESKDTLLMQLNNSTNSRSGLITLLATTGFLGFLSMFVALFIWYRRNNSKTKTTEVNLVKAGLVRVFLPFSILAAFVYSVEFTSIPLLAFSGISGLLSNISKAQTINESDET
jgi:hypothetical protein